MAEGLRYARQSAALRAILLRAFAFFLHSIALVALLPLVAKRLAPGPTTYALLLTAVGAGAVLAAVALPRLPGVAARDRVLDIGVLLYVVATVAAVIAPSLPWMLPALALSGTVWLCVVNTLTMAAQLAPPATLRARGMAIYQMAIMGGSTLGAALWGTVASHASVNASLLASAGLALLLMGLTRRVTLDAMPVASGRQISCTKHF